MLMWLKSQAAEFYDVGIQKLINCCSNCQNLLRISKLHLEHAEKYSKYELFNCVNKICSLIIYLYLFIIIYKLFCAQPTHTHIHEYTLYT